MKKTAKQLIWIAPLSVLIAGCSSTPNVPETAMAEWRSEYQLPPTGGDSQRVYVYTEKPAYPEMPRVVVDPGRKEGAAGDYALANSIRNSLEDNRGLAPSLQHTTIIVRDGWVTLRGMVRSDMDARLAMDSLREIPGVRRVKSELEINPRA